MDAEGEGVTYISDSSLFRDFMCEFPLEIPTHMDEFARDEGDIRDACFVSLFTNAEVSSGSIRECDDAGLIQSSFIVAMCGDVFVSILVAVD